MDDLQSLKQQLVSYLESDQGKLQMSASQAVAFKAQDLASHLDRLKTELDRCTTVDEVRVVVAVVASEIRAVDEKLEEAKAFYAELHKIWHPFGASR